MKMLRIIFTGKEYNFDKYTNSSIDSLGSPYDVTSIMHFGPKTFSENGKNTIESVDPSVSTAFAT